MKPDTELQLLNLSFERQGQLFFSNLNLILKAHESCLITGPNGSGKSSLLKIIVGLLSANTGDVLWNNTHIQKNWHAFKSQLHYLSHTNGIKLGLTVMENLQLMQSFSLSLWPDTSAAMLKTLNLWDKQQVYAKHLSAGLKRKLALARLLLFPKQLWVLDEPLTSLDLSSQAYFYEQMEMHLHRGGILIMSSHQLPGFSPHKIISLERT